MLFIITAVHFSAGFLGLGASYGVIMTTCLPPARLIIAILLRGLTRYVYPFFFTNFSSTRQIEFDPLFFFHLAVAGCATFKRKKREKKTGAVNQIWIQINFLVFSIRGNWPFVKLRKLMVYLYICIQIRMRASESPIGTHKLLPLLRVFIIIVCVWPSKRLCYASEDLPFERCV